MKRWGLGVLIIFLSGHFIYSIFFKSESVEELREKVAYMKKVRFYEVQSKRNRHIKQLDRIKVTAEAELQEEEDYNRRLAQQWKRFKNTADRAEKKLMEFDNMASMRRYFSSKEIDKKKLELINVIKKFRKKENEIWKQWRVEQREIDSARRKIENEKKKIYSKIKILDRKMKTTVGKTDITENTAPKKRLGKDSIKPSFSSAF